jgi:hypothetical protein
MAGSIFFRHSSILKKKGMRYKTFVSMNIAIIGVGETAENYAVNFACAGHRVFIGMKDEDKTAKHSSLRALDNVCFCSIEMAADVADMIIIATAPKDVREVAYWLGDVRRKVIIDASANVDAPEEDFVKTCTGIQAITGSPHVIKVFNTKGYEQLLKPIFREHKVELIMVGDSKKAKEVTKIMTVEMGINYCYDFGGNEAIPLFNGMTRCWRNLVIKNNEVNEEVMY